MSTNCLVKKRRFPRVSKSRGAVHQFDGPLRVTAEELDALGAVGLGDQVLEPCLARPWRGENGLELPAKTFLFRLDLENVLAPALDPRRAKRCSPALGGLAPTLGSAVCSGRLGQLFADVPEVLDRHGVGGQVFLRPLREAGRILGAASGSGARRPVDRSTTGWTRV